MIKFTYTDSGIDDANSEALVEIQTTVKHLDGVVEAFRTFLRLMSYHEDNVQSVQVVEPETHQALPTQLELPLTLREQMERESRIPARYRSDS